MRPMKDQLTDHQRQFAVEIFRGIDTDYSGMIDETVAVLTASLQPQPGDPAPGLRSVSHLPTSLE